MTSLDFSIDAAAGEWPDGPPPGRDAGPHEGGLLISSDVYAVLRMKLEKQSRSIRYVARRNTCVVRVVRGFFSAASRFEAREKTSKPRKKRKKRRFVFAFCDLSKSPYDVCPVRSVTCHFPSKNLPATSLLVNFTGEHVIGFEKNLVSPSRNPRAGGNTKSREPGFHAKILR